MLNIPTAKRGSYRNMERDINVEIVNKKKFHKGPSYLGGEWNGRNILTYFLLPLHPTICPYFTIIELNTTRNYRQKTPDVFYIGKCLMERV